jgi:hypothetical protein
MPMNPAFKASFTEWRTVLAAVQHYRAYLAASAPVIEDEGRQLVAYDDIERLDRIIRSLECQLNEEQHRQEATLAR